MKEIAIDELKNIQVDILQAIHDYCSAHGLKYSLCGGALIGAIRHKGFIPWDDDIDILMPRNDYMYLCNHFNDVEGPYKILSLYNDNRYDLPFAKVEDQRTVIDEVANSSIQLGISIDVFPYDNLGITKEESLAMEKKAAVWRTLYKGKLVKVSKRNSFIKKCEIYATKVVASAFSKRMLATILDNKSRKIETASSYVGDLVWGYGRKEIVPKEIFDKTVTVPFETRQFCAFKEYDYYLKQVYGDYMQLPPEDKRRSPHLITGAYWK